MKILARKQSSSFPRRRESNALGFRRSGNDGPGLSAAHRPSHFRPLLQIILMLCCGLTTTVGNGQTDRSSPPDGRSDLEINFSDLPVDESARPAAAPAPVELNLFDQDLVSSSPRSEASSMRYESHYAGKVLPAPKPDPTQYSSPSVLDASHAHTGFSRSISKRAALTYDEKYTGYYVGGGVPPGRWWNRKFGEPRYPHEGTWGMDYAPSYSRVISNWSHGRLYQGGTGLYEPDHRNRPFDLTFGRFR